MSAVATPFRRSALRTQIARTPHVACTASVRHMSACGSPTDVSSFASDVRFSLFTRFLPDADIICAYREGRPWRGFGPSDGT